MRKKLSTTHRIQRSERISRTLYASILMKMQHLIFVLNGTQRYKCLKRMWLFFPSPETDILLIKYLLEIALLTPRDIFASEVTGAANRILEELQFQYTINWSICLCVLLCDQNICWLCLTAKKEAQTALFWIFLQDQTSITSLKIFTAIWLLYISEFFLYHCFF